MATQPKTIYTYADLETFPEDNLRREIIDGELIVTASPVVQHQRVVVAFIMAFGQYARQHGGEVLPAPMDVFFDDVNVVEPDVLFVRADHLERVEKKFIRSAPDIVVEVSSPSTRRLELVRKRNLYERFGVAEYWYVDLEADRLEVYRLAEGRYGAPRILERGERLESLEVPGFSIPVEEVIGASEEE
ncbi:MAG: Uma2 family endonuclease [Actinomycetota bacterium]